MSRITWCNSVGGNPAVDNARSVPKKPVIWWGTVWLLLPNGCRHTQSWRTTTPITRQDAQVILRTLLDELIEECGRDAAIDSGFRLECR